MTVVPFRTAINRQSKQYMYMWESANISVYSVHAVHVNTDSLSMIVNILCEVNE